jgi:cytoskeleton protein RodZ
MATQPGSDQPLEIGSVLTQARTRQEIDLETVEARTKIRIKYLRALEDEEWDVLPAPAYARGFIRAYADVLGLDGEVLVDEYRRRHEEPPTTTYELPEPLLRGHRPDGAPRRPIWRTVIVAAVIAGVVAVLLVVGLTTGGEDEGSEPRSGKGKRQEQGRKQRRNTSSGSTDAKVAEPPKTATVKLVARSDVQACLVDDQGQVLVPNQLLTAGTEDGPYVSKKFKLELNPGAAQVMLNGEEARTPPSPEPVAYTVTPKGVEETTFTGALCP